MKTVTRVFLGVLSLVIILGVSRNQFVQTTNYEQEGDGSSSVSLVNTKTIITADGKALISGRLALGAY